MIPAEEIPGGSRPRQKHAEQAPFSDLPAGEQDRVKNAGHLVGIRFPDSARVYFFLADDHSITTGTWVVARTPRGEAAAQVVIAPRQILLSELQGDLIAVEWVMSDDDVAQMERYRDESAGVAKRIEEVSYRNNWHIESVAAEYSFDGSHLLVSCSARDGTGVTDLEKATQEEFGVAVEIRRFVPGEQARLVGGLGASGRRGRRVSDENEQYKKVKQQLPDLGQQVMTDEGEGTVVALQVFRQLVAVRYAGSGREEIYPAAELVGRPCASEERRAEPIASAMPDHRGEDESGGAGS